MLYNYVHAWIRAAKSALRWDIDIVFMYEIMNF